MQLSPVPNCQNVAWRLPGRLQSAMTSARIRKGHTWCSRRMVLRLTQEQRSNFRSTQNGRTFAPRDVSLLDRCRIISGSSSSLPMKRNDNRAHERRQNFAKSNPSACCDNDRCPTTWHHRHYSRVIINFSDYEFGAKDVNDFP